MPVASPDTQRIRNLARANEVRERRSQLKEDLRAGRILLSAALLSDDDWLRTMRVRDLLLATPGIGAVKADWALRQHGMSQSTQIFATTRTNREALLEYLAERHPSCKVRDDRV